MAVATKTKPKVPKHEKTYNEVKARLEIRLRQRKLNIKYGAAQERRRSQHIPPLLDDLNAMVKAYEEATK